MGPQGRLVVTNLDDRGKLMNKKLLALAVTSALAGVSAEVNADTANVNVYGKLYPQFQTISGKGASDTAGSKLVAPVPGGNLVSHQEINASNTYIGFKGEDNLGSGMKGWFQVEQQVNLDTGNGNWASRNSAAGLSGGFGNVFLGKWDTIYKQLGDPVGFLGVSSGNFVATSNVLSKPGFGAAGAASFHLRQNNYIEYDSPTFGGFTVMLGYSPDEAKTATRNQYLKDLGIKFEQGPLYVALQAEQHHDFFGGSQSLGNGVLATGINNLANGTFTAPAGSTALTTFANTAGTRSKDTAVRVSAMYKLPSNTSLGIDVAQMQYKEEGGAVGGFEKYKHKAVSLVATQQMGNLGLAASLVKADKGTCSLTGGADCITTGLDGQQVNLGVKYDFSKRTSVFAIYAKIMNKESAQYNNIASGVTVNPGVDPEQVAAGIVVSF